MTEHNRHTDSRTEGRQAQINRALGIFMVFFALVVLVAVAFTETAIGKLTNLGAGAIIGLIGALMIVRAGRRDHETADR